MLVALLDTDAQISLIPGSTLSLKGHLEEVTALGGGLIMVNYQLY